MSGSFCAVDIEKPLELLDPTHRGLHRFIPRHPDEIEIDIGDPVYVQKEAEDLWCEGESVQNCNFQPKKGTFLVRKWACFEAIKSLI